MLLVAGGNPRSPALSDNPEIVQYLILDQKMTKNIA